ncbi:sugar O-acyltransferase, sialic acid O-acetyltransferase NeuD family [Ectothiorhodosinus mongolicus]|uniref:Sugar O-acyltransferase, sialic acid O-acetyltransferase NeuD family n=1 Tax=Ectothiorhodosinus mongolicus TaxID=233100 RepID=A0A1R3VWX0_9GAMM|nr:acetyltransferase [Ectothiorhodosinus mongolicus]ULX56806.1 acetyltransferase [Ectothiorhodosinus mongolicus]SIT68402.1 sugar O-acyltransferase, sialic acid O-acetyltransferase NeuD family [Ectothiorhodosinus mongolicus]
MTSLLLIGGGGHCHSCIDVIEAEGLYRVAGIVQPSEEQSLSVMGYPIVGSDDDLPILLAQTSKALITVGQIRTPESRMLLYEQLKTIGTELPVIRSPYAIQSKHATLGEGTVLMHGCVVNANAKIGVNCIVNSQALIEHDVIIGDHCHISTGARVNGDVQIGNGCFIGSGAILREGIRIGAHAIIGAGQVVLSNVPDGGVVKK